MSTRTDIDRLPGECGLLLDMMHMGRLAEVVGYARVIARRSTDPHEATQAQVLEMAAHLNLGNVETAAYLTAEAATRTALERYPSPSLIGKYHTLRAFAAEMTGNVDRAVLEMAQSQLALEAEPEPGLCTAIAWRDLSAVQSIVGLVTGALVSLARSEEIASNRHLDVHAVGARLEAALLLDHQGDTDECSAQLEILMHTGRKHARTGFERMDRLDATFLAYAAARVLALGGDPGIDPRRVVPPGHDEFTPDLNKVVLAGHAISTGRADTAVALLNSIGPDNQLGTCELMRMRSLALSALGDHAGALAAERQSFRELSERLNRLHHLMVGHEGVRADQALLRETLATYAAASLTDPLTGLPNRRHLDQRLSELVSARRPAALGVLDLNKFKEVNTVHGHVVGDRVLRQVAEVLVRSLRADDFLARYGGDEFVALLPGSSLLEAHEVGCRAAAAVAAQDWHGIAPGTPVGVAIGWTDLSSHRSAQAAVAAADQAMYAAKS